MYEKISVLLLPEFFLAVTASLLLMADNFMEKNKRKWAIYYISQSILFSCLYLNLNLQFFNRVSVFNDSFVLDDFSTILKELMCILSGMRI